MKVLHLVAGHASSGAARGALNLHQGLLSENVESYILFSLDMSAHLHYKNCLNADLFPGFHLLTKIISKTSTLYPLVRSSHSYSSFSLFLGYPLLLFDLLFSPDIIHLHNVTGFICPYLTFGLKSKVFWTIRDMTPLTGGCSYSLTCQKYLYSDCISCPASIVSWNFIPNLIFKLKGRFLSKTINLVGISHWIADELRKSSLFTSNKISMIYNSIDTTTFCPISSSDSFSRNFIIGAQEFNSPYKGSDLLFQFLRLVDAFPDSNFFVFGNIDSQFISSFPSNVIPLGFIDNDKLLSSYYSSSLAHIVFSRQETFCKTLAESMACGTPVICFNTSAPSELVTHKVNGYVVKSFDVQGIFDGISWFLSLDSDDYQSIANNAREFAVSNFSLTSTSLLYIQHYKSVY